MLTLGLILEPFPISELEPINEPAPIRTESPIFTPFSITVCGAISTLLPNSTFLAMMALGCIAPQLFFSG